MTYKITITMEGNDLSQLIARLSRLQGVTELGVMTHATPAELNPGPTPAELSPGPSQDPIDNGVEDTPAPEDQNKYPEPPEDPEQPEDPAPTLVDLQEAGMKAAKRVAAKREITSAAAIKVVQATIGGFTPTGQGSAREVPAKERPGLLKALAELE